MKWTVPANQQHDKALWFLWSFLLLAVTHLKPHCLLRAKILQSRGRRCQAWLWGYYKKGKPIFPQNLLPLQKRGFPLLSKLSVEVFQATWKTSIAAFSVFMLAKSSVTGAAWSFHSSFSEEKADCACVFTSFMLSFVVCMYCWAAQLTGLWNISTCIVFPHSNLCNWCGHEYAACVWSTSF